VAYNRMVLQGHKRQVKPKDSVDFGFCCEAEELANAGSLKHHAHITGSQIRNRRDHDDSAAHFKNSLPISSSLPSFSPSAHPFLVVLGFSQNFVLSSASLV
jgi:hypothetical protein